MIEKVSDIVNQCRKKQIPYILSEVLLIVYVKKNKPKYLWYDGIFSGTSFSKNEVTVEQLEELIK